MADYSASQIIGKTLVAKSNVNITRTGLDGAAVVYVAAPGKTIGVVTSYLLPKEGRTNLWWQFEDNNGTPFYAEHKTGAFDIQSLESQGALTIKEEAQAEADKNKTFVDKIIDFAQKNVSTALWIGGAYLALKILTSGNKKK